MTSPTQTFERGVINHPPWPDPERPLEPIAEPIGPTTDQIILDRLDGTLEGSQRDIAAVCDEIKELLLEKNRKYGDSALNPSRIFAKSDTLEQIRVRMDDKLNRIKALPPDENEDVILDLLGYLVLYRVAQKQQEDGEK